METLLKTDTSLHAELLAEIQKELNVDLNRAKSSQKKEANDDVIKARTLWSVYIVLTLTNEMKTLFHVCINYKWYYYSIIQSSN